VTETAPEPPRGLGILLGDLLGILLGVVTFTLEGLVVPFTGTVVGVLGAGATTGEGTTG